MEAVVKQGVEFLKREERRVQNLLKGKVRSFSSWGNAHRRLNFDPMTANAIVCL